MQNTPRLQIPTPTDPDQPDLPTHLRNMAMAVDNAEIALVPGTLALRPAANLRGRYYRATDDGVLYRDTGTTWEPINPIGWIGTSVRTVDAGEIGPSNEEGIRFGATDDARLYRQAANTLRTDSQMQLVRTGSNTALATYLLNTDANPALLVRGDGRMRWGPGGATAFDTELFRNSAGVLKTPGAFISDGDVTITTGQLKIGADVNLYRAAVDVIQTDDEFRGAGRIVANFGLAAQVDATAAGQVVFGSAGDTNIYRSAANVLRTDDSLAVGATVAAGSVAQGFYFDVANFRADWTKSTGSGLLLRTFVTADANPRFQAAANGALSWGDGTLAPDVTLYRSVADILKTDDGFHVAGSLGLGVGTIPTASATINLPSATSVAGGGILWGTDTNLYRSNTSTLRTDGTFHVGANLRLVGTTSQITVDGLSGAANVVYNTRVTGDAASRFNAKADGKLEWGGGAVGIDTNLYRDAAGNILKTDDEFQAVGRVTSKLGLATETSIGDVGPASQAAIKINDMIIYRDAVGMTPAGLRMAAQFASDSFVTGSLGSVGGQVFIGAGVGGKAGVVFGTAADTSLYRDSAGVLRTGQELRSDLEIVARNTGAGQVRIGALVGGSAAIAWGSAGDTTLYRDGVGILRTGHFTVGGALSHIGSSLAFFNAGVTAAKQTVTGSRGANAALASLLTALSTYGLITDSTT